ncbi:hypothetical protein ACWEVP_21175 [Amycolatopsis sp. NPDC003865]
MPTIARARRRAPGNRLVNALVVWLLGSALAPLVNRRLCALRYRPASSAEPVTFPVGYTRSAGRVVVVAGNPDAKRWWRHFRGDADAELLLDGHWAPTTGRLLDGPARTAAAAGLPRVPVPPDAPVVAFTAPARIPPGRGPALRWFVVVTFAEFVGFAVPATAGALTADRPAAVVVPVMLLAGALEGTALGCGQAWVLRRVLPAFESRAWVAATAVAAAIAYAIGLAPSTWLPALTKLPPALLWPTVTVMGTTLLLSIGFAQWLVLRRRLARSSGWVAATAGAWLLGLAVFLGVTMPLWQPGQPVATTIVVGAFGGLLMAATTSAVTGLALGHLTDRRAAVTAYRS